MALLIAKKEAQLERLALEKQIDSRMAIFSLKQLGWKDKAELEHTGNVTVEINVIKRYGPVERHAPVDG